MKEKQFFNENEQKRVNKLVDDMTLFDDDLMSHVFDKNIEATELILRIILGEDIKVISVDGQDELKNPLVDGRNITLDVHAVDSHGKEMDIEVQGDAKGASVERARFHSSMMDARMLKASQDFKELKERKSKKYIPMQLLLRPLNTGAGRHFIRMHVVCGRISRHPAKKLC